MSLNDPDQQSPELIEFDDIVNNENYPPWPSHIVSKWRIGSQLRHAMETESAYIGHQQGAMEFIRLLKEFEQKDMDNILMRDIDIILEIMTTFDRKDLLSMLIQHPYLSQMLKPEWQREKGNDENIFGDDDDEHEQKKSVNNRDKQRFKPLQSTLKKAIRTGKIKVLNYLITQDIIPIKLFDDERIQSKQYETDLKSLLYNILRAIEIGSKKARNDCFDCAQQFWPYLANKVNDLKQSLFTNDDKKNKDKENKDKFGDNKALKKLISINNENDDGQDNEMINNLKAMNDDYLIIKYLNMFMDTMFSRNKKINKEQLLAIFDVLRFERERYITFQDRTDIENTWKVLYNQLVINYLQLNYNKNNDCLELEMIDYLISGGVIITDKDKESINNNINIQKAIENGKNNWKLKNLDSNKIQSIMPQLLPIEINALIINLLCL